MVWRFSPAVGDGVARATDGVVRAGGVALAVRVGGGGALALRVGDGVATGESPNENGTVVAPVPAVGGGAVVALCTTGLAGGGRVGATAAAVLAPTNLAALSSGNDAVSLVTGAGGGALMRVRGGAGEAAGNEATRVPASADAAG